MKVITVSGPPTSGKTSILIHVLKHLKRKHYNPLVIKFDCLLTDDHLRYKNMNVTCQVGLSGTVCPDHYFVSNVEDCLSYAKDKGYDMLITESAGLCNRCSPYIEDVCAVCVIDNLSGMDTPKKIGPMLKMADVVVITKGDVVSQAEREIFSFKILQANPRADIVFVDGITGQGALELSKRLEKAKNIDSFTDKRLRVCMPSALCSYCLGALRIGNDDQLSQSQKVGWL